MYCTKTSRPVAKMCLKAWATLLSIFIIYIVDMQMIFTSWPSGILNDQFNPINHNQNQNISLIQYGYDFVNLVNFFSLVTPLCLALCKPCDSVNRVSRHAHTTYLHTDSFLQGLKTVKQSNFDLYPSWWSTNTDEW